MRKNINFFILFFFSFNLFSQNTNDVIYLKNGNIIKGMIIEQIPNQSVKIETKDKSVFVLQYTEIEKLTKEALKQGHLFNYPVGTKFTNVTYVKKNKTISVVEIKKINKDELIYETSIETNPSQKTTTESKLIYENGFVIYNVATPEFILNPNSDIGIKLPLQPTVGQKLNDINISGTISQEGININSETKYYDRQIIGYETITTPAGSFECYVLTYQMSIKASFVSINQFVKSWGSDKTGIVKTETYKKDKLESMMQIESIN